MAIDPTLITTVSVNELPPAAVTLTSLIAHETISDGLLKQVSVEDLITFITPFMTAIQYQVITLHVDSTYIEDNFDETGLGTNLMIGYAICNGQNGTINKDGRVGIAYGAVYNAIGAIGGSKDAVIVAHSHGIKYGENGAGTKYPETPYISDVLGGSMQGTETTGVSGTNQNMQPYLVELQIMKL